MTFSFSCTKADFLSNKCTRADTQIFLLIFFTVCFIEKSHTSTVSMEKSYHDGATLKKSLQEIVPQGNVPQGNVPQGNVPQGNQDWHLRMFQDMEETTLLRQTWTP